MAEKYFPVNDGEQLLQLAEKLEQRDVKIFTAFIDSSPDISIQKMISSIRDGDEAHLEQIQECRSRMDVSSAKVEPFKIGIPDVVLAVSPPGKEALAFLRFVTEREEALTAIFRDLSAKAGDRALSELFSTLADGKERHRNWARDRLELQELKG